MFEADDAAELFLAYDRTGLGTSRRVTTCDGPDPDGAPFSHEGFPQFERYALATVVLEDGFKGRKSDRKRANQLAGFEVQPEGTVWHHNEDRKTILLLPDDLHATVGHWGGIRRTESRTAGGNDGAGIPGT
ncbi:HNH endonuclease [Microlunatus sp. GCM10028923]|uniref:HNH endonuclease n=1 Tax=Microlunatus sp. GCM10028923 TaxID=3273400 RepID=UPI00360FA929